MDSYIAPPRDLLSLWRLWRIMRNAIGPHSPCLDPSRQGCKKVFGCGAATAPLPFLPPHGFAVRDPHGIRRRLSIYARAPSLSVLAHRVVFSARAVREKAIAFGTHKSGSTVVFGLGVANGGGSVAFQIDGTAGDGSRGSRVAISVRNPRRKAPVLLLLGV